MKRSATEASKLHLPPASPDGYTRPSISSPSTITSRQTALFLAVLGAFLGLGVKEVLNAMMPTALLSMASSFNKTTWVEADLTGVGDVGYAICKVAYALLIARIGALRGHDIVFGLTFTTPSGMRSTPGTTGALAPLP